MVQICRAKLRGAGLGVFFISLLLILGFSPRGPATAVSTNREPSVLIVYDGLDQQGSPGRLDALYLGNLLGHFTTHRRIIPIDHYRTDLWKSYDAIFCIVYDKKFTVPPL